ncbi:MAG: hypothetical protein J0I47_13415 [Sphingomonas sp.]|nr:hypothetical protein [Sphingomonas sp.]MBN8809218.1 hypothetical protein [Sphingomonas sp.]
MKHLIKSATLWRFLGGFVAGGVGVLALHPATAEPVVPAASPIAITAAR